MSELQLNVGCGEFRAPGWVNVDRAPHLEPDLVASADQLPHATGSVARIYAGHVLEHLAWPEQVDDALREFHRVLEPGGRLMVVGPDIDRADPADVELVESIRYGGQRWEGDCHLWACTEALVVEALERVFGNAHPVPIVAVPVYWPVVSRIGWQCAAWADR